MKKVIFSLLLICLLAVPGSAYTWSGFGHSDDTDFTELVTAGSPTIATQNGRDVFFYNEVKTSAQTFTLALPRFDGDFSFTVNTVRDSTWSNSPDTRLGITLIDSEEVTVINNCGYTYNFLANGPARYRVVTNAYETGIEVYRNGVLVASSTTSGGDLSDIAKVKFTFYSPWSGIDFSFFDFSDEDFGCIVGLDEYLTEAYSDFYVSYGIYPTANYHYVARLYAPNSSIIDERDITGSGAVLYDNTLYAGDGPYTARLLVYNEVIESYYLRADNYFYWETGVPGISYLSLSKPSLAPSEQLYIYVTMPEFIQGCKVVVDGPANNDGMEYEVTSAEQSFSYTVPLDSVEGQGLVIFRGPSGTRLDYLFYDVIGGTGAGASVNFDKEVYVNTDKVGISYSDLPSGSQIKLTGSMSGSSTKVFEETYSKSGDGIFYYQLSGQIVSSIGVVAAYDSEFLDRDTASVAYGDDYVIYGTVYDANTLSPISGATVNIAGSIKYTDETGRYDMTVSAGTQNISSTADGYNTLSTTIDIISVSTQKNIYLVPVTSSEEGFGAIYGACADYETGQAIGTAYIQISNSSGVTYSALGRSSTGSYIFEGLPNGSTWTLKASKTGYDNYQQQITVNGSTFQLIRLVSQDYGGSTPPEDDDGDSTDSSTDDRPSREAAKDSLTWLEETMPGLVKLAVLVFMLALVGWRF